VLNLKKYMKAKSMTYLKVYFSDQ